MLCLPPREVPGGFKELTDHLFVQRSKEIPLDAGVPLMDPRSRNAEAQAAQQRIKLALPPFSLLPPRQAEPAESSGISWAGAPTPDLRDEAISEGRSVCQIALPIDMFGLR